MVKKRSRGRPQLYSKVGYLPLRGHAAEIRELKAFAAWLSKRAGKRVSIARAVLDSAKRSPEFRAFLRAR